MRHFAFRLAWMGALAGVIWTAEALAAEREVRVTARSGLRVRSSNGDILCVVPYGTRLTATARHSDGERVQVRVNAPGCPRNGFVYSSYVLPTNASFMPPQMEVDVDGLSLRSAPRVDDATWKCGMAKGTKVTVIDDNDASGANAGWARVRLTPPIPGCPEEGYAKGGYLRGDELYKDLPPSEENVNTSSSTEAGTECMGDCDPERGGPTRGNMSDLRDTLAALPQDGKNPWLEELRKMIQNPKYKPQGLKSNRGLVQIPLLGDRGNIGPCGSHHYNPDSPKGVDAYANPLTACVFTGVLQEWKQKHCNGRTGCTLAWGDISHKTKAKWNGHQTHTDGHCIDIRPMRKGGFKDEGMNYNMCTKWRGSGKNARCVGKWVLNPSYDQGKMKDLVGVLKKYGGSNILFNDTACGTTRAGGHSNHLHVCFKNNQTTRNACANLKVDPNTCPELQ